MPQDFEVELPDGKKYRIGWDKPTPPTDADFKAIVEGIQGQSATAIATKPKKGTSASSAGALSDFAPGAFNLPPTQGLAPVSGDAMRIAKGGVSPQPRARTYSTPATGENIPGVGGDGAGGGGFNGPKQKYRSSKDIRKEVNDATSELEAFVKGSGIVTPRLPFGIDKFLEATNPGLGTARKLAESTVTGTVMGIPNAIAEAATIGDQKSTTNEKVRAGANIARDAVLMALGPIAKSATSAKSLAKIAVSLEKSKPQFFNEAVKTIDKAVKAAAKEGVDITPHLPENIRAKLPTTPPVHPPKAPPISGRVTPKGAPVTSKPQPPVPRQGTAPVETLPKAQSKDVEILLPDGTKLVRDAKDAARLKAMREEFGADEGPKKFTQDRTTSGPAKGTVKIETPGSADPTKAARESRIKLDAAKAEQKKIQDAINTTKADVTTPPTDRDAHVASLRAKLEVAKGKVKGLTESHNANVKAMNGDIAPVATPKTPKSEASPPKKAEPVVAVPKPKKTESVAPKPPESVKVNTPESPKVAAPSRRVTVNGEEYDLTGEALDAYDKAVAAHKQSVEAQVKGLRFKDEIDAAKKSAGVRLSAELRRIVGGQTEREAKQAAIDANKITPGMTVKATDGTIGKAKSNAYGKVTIELEDGTTRTFARSDVSPSVVKPTGGMAGATKATPVKAVTETPKPAPKTSEPVTSGPPPRIVGTAKQVTERPSKPGISVKDIAEQGKAAYQSGKVVPKDVAARVAKTGTPMDEVEISASTARLSHIRDLQDDLLAQQAKASDPLHHQHLEETYQQLEAESKDILEATDYSLNKSFHKAGQAAQVAYAPDYRLSTLKARARSNNMGADVTGPQAMNIEASAKDFKAANDGLKEAASAYEATIPKLKTEPTGKTNVAKSTSDLRKYFGNEKGSITEGSVKGKQSGAVSYSIPDAEWQAMRAARALAKDIVTKGKADNLTTLLDEMRKAIGYQISDKHLMRLISDPYRKYLLESDVARMKADMALRDVQRSAQARLRPPLKKAWDTSLEILNTTQRSMQTAADLSAPFIQGRKGLFANPAGWAKAWKPMMEAAIKGEDVAVRSLAKIEGHPMYPRFKAAGGELARVGGSFTQQEEQFAGNFIRVLAKSKIPILKQYAQVLEHSEAAYVTFLNELRFDTFKNMARLDPKNPAYLRDIANQINVIYGRGAGEIAKIAGKPGAGAFFYAPRYKVSQIQYAIGQPLLWGSETKAGRAMAARTYAAQAATMGSMVALAKMAGWEIDTDSRSQDYGKISVKGPQGVMKVDLFAKEAQAHKLVMQSVYGKVAKSGKFEGPSKINTAKNVGMFLLNQLTPLPKTVGEGITGHYDPKAGETRPLTGGDIAQGYLPLWLQSGIQDGTIQTGPANFVGIDAQTETASPTTKRVGRIGSEHPLEYLKPGLFNKKQGARIQRTK